MNRRELIVGSAAAGAVASLATLPALASPVSGIVAHPRITFATGSQMNPHAAMMARECVRVIHDGVIYARGELGYEVKMTDPRFHIVAGKPVWNWMTGYTDETGVAAFITERGIPLGHVGIATSIGYEGYWSEETGKTRDKERYPDYFVRSLWLPYEEMKLIEPHLPKGHIEPDMRWLKHYQKLEADDYKVS